MINKKTMDHPKFSYLGNTAMHPPGMFGVSMPQGMAGMPGVTAVTTKMMKKQIADLDVPEVPEFLEIISASGGKLWACRMSADMMKLHEEDLYEGVDGIISATDFMELTDGAQLLFI
ncbi:MAG: DsrE/DsrF/DrsH-like family protein [Nocardioides sp.]